MNRHIIVEEQPGAMRRIIMAAVMSCSAFFVLGFVSRPLIDVAWASFVGTETQKCEVVHKKSLQWK